MWSGSRRKESLHTGPKVERVSDRTSVVNGLVFLAAYRVRGIRLRSVFGCLIQAPHVSGLKIIF